MFVKVTQDNQIEKYPYSIEQFRMDNRNVSFPSAIPDTLLANYSVLPVRVADKPDHDTITQHVYPNDTPQYVNGEWVIDWNIVEKDQAWMDTELEQQKQKVRAERDKLLAETDWVSVRAFDTNTSVDTAWSQYRQELRDVTAQDGFPWNVVWPQKP